MIDAKSKIEVPKPIILDGKVQVNGKDISLQSGETVYAAEGMPALQLKKYKGKLVSIQCIVSSARSIVQIEKIKKLKQLQTWFMYPCADYKKGLKGRGNFGIKVSAKAAPGFAGKYHLAEDIWLKGGTEVYAAADGKVMYSDFCPTWTDKQGRKRWGFGNVIIIEHQLNPAIDGLDTVCSLYVHLGKDRKVKAGDNVRRGDLIGYIGEDKSEENGLYPQHLHFGLHKGSYIQIPPAWKKDTISEISDKGFPGRDGQPIKGQVDEIKMQGEDSVLITLKDQEKQFILSLMYTTSFEGTPKPADLPVWVHGYGKEKYSVEDWLKPSDWIKKQLHPLDK
jgi:hypothetical protein